MRSTTGARRRWARRLGALALGLAGALVASELALRMLLFSEKAAGLRLAESLRQELRYVVGPHQDDYWKLQVHFNPTVTLEPPGPDPIVGWTGVVYPGSYVHRDERRIGDRRPVLLYGDSFAQCVTGTEACFQELLEKSDLASSHVLLNYGVGGYGLDQIYLLLRESVDRFADRNPVVIVSMLIDDDLERSMLSFRCWPKPRFGLRDGELVEPEPVLADTLEYLKRNPPAIPSYLYRLLSLRDLSPPERMRRSEAELEERRALNRALLQAIQEELESRSLDYFFLLFYHRYGLQRYGMAEWSEDLVLEYLAESGAPYVSMRDFIGALCDAPWTCIESLSGKGDVNLENHYGPGGNRLAFEAMRQGMEGRFGGDVDLERVRRMAGDFLPDRDEPRTVEVAGRNARFYSRAFHDCMRLHAGNGPSGGLRLGLRAGDGDDFPTRLEIDLEGRARRLLARARAAPAGACEGALRLLLRVDGGEWREERFELGAPARPLSVELAGAGMLTLQVELDGPRPECIWLALEGLRIE